MECRHAAIYPPPRKGEVEVVAWEDIRRRALEDSEVRRNVREFGDQLDGCGAGVDDGHFQTEEGGGGVPASGAEHYTLELIEAWDGGDGGDVDLADGGDQIGCSEG